MWLAVIDSECRWGVKKMAKHLSQPAGTENVPALDELLQLLPGKIGCPQKFGIVPPPS